MAKNISLQMRQTELPRNEASEVKKMTVKNLIFICLQQHGSKLHPLCVPNVIKIHPITVKSIMTSQCHYLSKTSLNALLYSLQTGSGWNQYHPDPAGKLSANLYDIYHCCVYSEKLLMINRGTV
jgi:hypothetical protein